MSSIDEAEAAYIAALKADIEAADAHDAPILDEIKALNMKLSAVVDPTIKEKRIKYQMVSVFQPIVPKTTNDFIA